MSDPSESVDAMRRELAGKAEPVDDTPDTAEQPSEVVEKHDDVADVLGERVDAATELADRLTPDAPDVVEVRLGGDLEGTGLPEELESAPVVYPAPVDGADPGREAFKLEPPDSMDDLDADVPDAPDFDPGRFGDGVHNPLVDGLDTGTVTPPGTVTDGRSFGDYVGDGISDTFDDWADDADEVPAPEVPPAPEIPDDEDDDGDDDTYGDDEGDGYGLDDLTDDVTDLPGLIGG